MAGPGEQATHNFERILCPFSQNAHKDTLFHIKNYTPLCNRCQPFAQIPAVEKRIFVAMYRFSIGVLCKLTYIFMASHIFSVVFCTFAGFPSVFHSPITQIWHTAFCDTHKLFCQLQKPFYPFFLYFMIWLHSVYDSNILFCDNKRKVQTAYKMAFCRKEHDMVEIQNLTKYYGNKAALKGISFTIKENEVLGFLGRLLPFMEV